MIAPAAIARSFGRSAARYRQHARVQTAMADWLAEWLPHPSARTGRALELGAGPGTFTERVQSWAGPILVTDLSPEMCAEGARRLPRLTWQAAAAEQPPAGPWDWIFSSSMLQWVAEPRSVFSAWRAQLAPSGRILGGLFVAPTIPEWYGLDDRPAPFEWRTDARWIAAMESAGLNVARSETTTFLFEFPSALEFLRSIHAVGAAPARRSSAPGLRSLLREYDARFSMRPGQAAPTRPAAADSDRTNSPVRSTWTFFRFEATS